MNCKWCDKELTEKQVYSFLRGKSKGNACSSSCSLNLIHYKDRKDKINKTTKKCEVCGTPFTRGEIKKYRVCSTKCGGVLTSKRMKDNNPMKSEATRKKVSKTLKKMALFL